MGPDYEKSVLAAIGVVYYLRLDTEFRKKFLEKILPGSKEIDFGDVFREIVSKERSLCVLHQADDME